MLRFLAGRLFSSFLSIIGATLAIFTLTNFHNDPRLLFVPDSGNGITQEQWDKLGERLGMNKPFHERYIDWIGRTLRGDLGISLARQMAVTEIVMAKIPATLELALGGWIFAILLGIPTGVVAAVFRGSFWDYVARGAALVGQAAPPFVTGLVLIYIFNQWIQPGGEPYCQQEEESQSLM